MIRLISVILSMITCQIAPIGMKNLHPKAFDYAFQGAVEFTLADWSGSTVAAQSSALPSQLQNILADMDSNESSQSRDKAQAELLKYGVGWNYRILYIGKRMASPEVYCRARDNLHALTRCELCKNYTNLYQVPCHMCYDCTDYWDMEAQIAGARYILHAK